jgi:hypothetical protein
MLADRPVKMLRHAFWINRPRRAVLNHLVREYPRLVAGATIGHYEDKITGIRFDGLTSW